MNEQEINKVFCRISGVKFYMIDSIGLRYQAETANVHPVFLDSDNLRAILKHEWRKARTGQTDKVERLFNLDWQDISLGSDKEHKIKKDDQILAKSFIVGVILAQLHNLKLSYQHNISGRQVHEINLALCAHNKRQTLLWYARRLCNWPKNREAARINLDTIYDQHHLRTHSRLHISKAITSYLASIIEDETDRLPRMKGRKQSSITIYGSSLPSGRRMKNAEKPLNGNRVDWGLNKAAEGIRTLKAAGVLDKKQYNAIYYTMLNWADVSDTTLARLGDRLQELSNEHCLKQDYQNVLERVGLAFSTGEIKIVGHAANYTLGERFLDEEVKPVEKPKTSLLDTLRSYKQSPKPEGLGS